MADLQELLTAIPISDIAKQLGVKPEVAEVAVKQVLPTLIGGMAANAKDEAGAASLTKALDAHRGGAASVSSVAEIDTGDGEKIVQRVFGGNKDQVVAAVAKAAPGDVTQDIVAKVLPIVAPIVLAWLAQKFLGGKAEPAATKDTGAGSGGGIGDLLGGFLGGGGGSGGPDLGGLLGGLLGGGKR